MQGLITSHESLTSAMISLQVRLLDQLRPTLLSSINPCSLSHIHFRVQMVLRVLGGSSNPPPRLQVSFVRGGGRLDKFILVEMQLAHSIGETVECRLGVSQWASQLSLVGCRPHHFDSTRDSRHHQRLHLRGGTLRSNFPTSRATNKPLGLEHPSTPGLSPEPR